MLIAHDHVELGPVELPFSLHKKTAGVSPGG
jgi:hypothetical protein